MELKNGNVSKEWEYSRTMGMRLGNVNEEWKCVWEWECA